MCLFSDPVNPFASELAHRIGRMDPSRYREAGRNERAHPSLQWQRKQAPSGCIFLTTGGLFAPGVFAWPKPA